MQPLLQPQHPRGHAEPVRVSKEKLACPVCGRERDSELVCLRCARDRDDTVVLKDRPKPLLLGSGQRTSQRGLLCRPQGGIERFVEVPIWQILNTTPAKLPSGRESRISWTRIAPYAFAAVTVPF